MMASALFPGKAAFIMAFSASLTIRNALGSFRFDYYLWCDTPGQLETVALNYRNQCG
jgi:hypothetical protein